MPSEQSSSIAAEFSKADKINTMAAWDEFLSRNGHLDSHPLVALAESKRSTVIASRTSSNWSTGVEREAESIQSELVFYAAAERLSSPRSWALFFDRFPVGRLVSSALEKELHSLVSDLTAKEFGMR